jgi:hypothetical protein
MWSFGDKTYDKICDDNFFCIKDENIRPYFIEAIKFLLKMPKKECDSY